MICGSSLQSGVHETMLTTALRASWNAVGLRRCVEPFLQCWSSASIGLKNWVNRNRSGMVDRNSDARFSLFQSYHNDNYMFEIVWIYSRIFNILPTFACSLRWGYDNFDGADFHQYKSWWWKEESQALHYLQHAQRQAKDSGMKMWWPVKIQWTSANQWLGTNMLHLRKFGVFGIRS